MSSPSTESGDSGARYRGLLEAAPDAMVVVDAAGNIVLLNVQAEKQFGYRRDELVGQPVKNIIPVGFAERLIADALRSAEDALAQQIGTGLELHGRRKDGTGFPIEIMLSPLASEDGILVTAAIRNITKRKNAEAHLRQSEEQYRVLFDGNPHPMYVFDAETLVFLAVNDAAVRHYGYAREEFLGLGVASLRRPSEVPALMRSIAAAANRPPEGGNTLGVFEHCRKDGSAVQMEIAANRIRFRGRPAWLTLAMDVTAKRDLEAQLRQSQKMESVGRLAGGVAHDFNNILGVITGYGELLARRLPGDPRLHKYATDIVQAAERGAGLTRQLLAFSRSQVLKPTILDLNVVVREMERMLRRLIGEDVELVTLFDEGLGAVTADAGQMEQILMNLAVNARDAMAGGGRLTIETRNCVLDAAGAALLEGVRPGRYSVVSVTDSGQGMTREVIARMFEPFFTTKERGTGLGLATVHGIVKQSGGDIRVESAPGKGTTFDIYLPSSETAGASDAGPAAAVELPLGTETVLLVEDEQSLREIVRECLELTGYTVLDAASGDEALETCRRHAGVIHLLMTDVVMPGLGGRALAERIQAIRPDLRTLYMSGYTDDAVVLRGVLSAQMAFLQKPFTAHALAAKVRAVLDAPR